MRFVYTGPRLDKGSRSRGSSSTTTEWVLMPTKGGKGNSLSLFLRRFATAFCCLHLPSLSLPAFVLCLARIRARLIYFKQLATSYINDFCSRSLFPLSLSLFLHSFCQLLRTNLYAKRWALHFVVALHPAIFQSCFIRFSLLLSFQFESQKLSKIFPSFDFSLFFVM